MKVQAGPKGDMAVIVSPVCTRLLELFKKQQKICSVFYIKHVLYIDLLFLIKDSAYYSVVYHDRGMTVVVPI